MRTLAVRPPCFPTLVYLYRRSGLASFPLVVLSLRVVVLSTLGFFVVVSLRTCLRALVFAAGQDL